MASEFRSFAGRIIGYCAFLLSNSDNRFYQVGMSYNEMIHKDVQLKRPFSVLARPTLDSH